MNDDKRKRWLDSPSNVNKVNYGLWIVCALSLLADLFYEKQGYFYWEKWFGMHAWFGFVACVILVLAAKQLRKLLQRPEDYYDR